jgi:hypothetical protein
LIDILQYHHLYFKDIAIQIKVPQRVKGEVFLDIQEDKTNRKLLLTCSIKRGKMRRLDQRLWLMGNTSIGHSKRFAEGDDNPFAVIFDPAEVDEALDIPSDDIRIIENTLFRLAE